ncbi:MAG: isoprenylcysteine carboxylmethyltransferase family protein [Ferruginibacter sp.]|jgi:protein-S-isoprenylcysteine O-methyltransferase Ste14|nr:isoprenylcysteine carboxylmethyltransferase family protein [Ferruginibacter sp.]
MQTFLKIYLPVYLILYMAVAFVLPTYRTWKQTGVNPVTFGKTDTAHNYIGFLMKLLIVLLFVALLIFSFNFPAYEYLLPFWYLQHQIILYSGLALIHIALLWVVIAQFQMSKSWRIGIDEENKTELVTVGLFSISRNPIFLGMILSVTGIFLIIPNVLTFFLCLFTYFVIQIQIRLEEEFLIKQHGDEYLHYKQKTRRLL